jgi:outer membrane lipoprotein-sorting protein
MRKAVISALMIPLLLLAGCGKQEAKLKAGLESFRQSITDAQSITAQTELTADWGESTQSYTLDMTCTPGAMRLEILAPELIAGIKATVTDDGAQVEYDGVMLSVPPVSEDGLTPVSALPAVLKAARDGYSEQTWWEDGYIAARFYVSENSSATVWINPETLALKWAEISTDGRTVISCTFSAWEIS